MVSLMTGYRDTLIKYILHLEGIPMDRTPEKLAKLLSEDIRTNDGFLYEAEDNIMRRDAANYKRIAKEILNSRDVKVNARTAYLYARDVIKGRWPEAERFIEEVPEWAHAYARDIIKGRWREAERFIMEDPESAYYYASHIIKGPWPEAEEYIRKDPFFWNAYKRFLSSQRNTPDRSR